MTSMLRKIFLLCLAVIILFCLLWMATACRSTRSSEVESTQLMNLARLATLTIADTTTIICPAAITTLMATTPIGTNHSHENSRVGTNFNFSQAPATTDGADTIKIIRSAQVQLADTAAADRQQRTSTTRTIDAAEPASTPWLWLLALSVLFTLIIIPPARQL